jgi:hypothetical protein
MMANMLRKMWNPSPDGIRFQGEYETGTCPHKKKVLRYKTTQLMFSPWSANYIPGLQKLGDVEGGSVLSTMNLLRYHAFAGKATGSCACSILSPC